MSDRPTYIMRKRLDQARMRMRDPDVQHELSKVRDDSEPVWPRLRTIMLDVAHETTETAFSDPMFDELMVKP